MGRWPEMEDMNVRQPISTMPLSDIVSEYNALTDASVETFADREAAEAALWAARQEAGKRYARAVHSSNRSAGAKLAWAKRKG